MNMKFYFNAPEVNCSRGGGGGGGWGGGLLTIGEARPVRVTFFRM